MARKIQIADVIEMLASVFMGIQDNFSEILLWITCVKFEVRENALFNPYHDWLRGRGCRNECLDC